SASEEDNDLEQAQRDKDMKKSITLIAKKPKRAKDYSYYNEKMMLCKQEEKGVPLCADQSDWLHDTGDEPDEQELEAYYLYMTKIQEVLDVSDDNSEPTYDAKPLEKVQSKDDYNVFANDRHHSEQLESINDTYVVEPIDSLVIPDSSNMCNNEFDDD
nr:hypothetical protein [Tanacetum cinerariifolium]